MTDAAAPQVSVIIAAWNADRTIARAIESALAQTVPVEVIVVDDASTDRTKAIATDLAANDPRLVVLAQDHNAGPAAARNRALSDSRAPWVTVLDADDFMAPDRLACLLRIATDTDADFVADDLYKVSEDAPDGPRQRMWSDQDIGQEPLTAAGFVDANLSTRHGGRRELGFLKPLMSRAFLQDHDLRYDDIRLGEDYVLYTRALVLGARFILTDPAGYVAVVRSNSLSGQHPTSAHGDLVAADEALLQLPGLDAKTRKALDRHRMEQRKKWAWRRLIDAVGARDVPAALACFAAPPPVIADLLRRLAAELMTRTVGKRAPS